MSPRDVDQPAAPLPQPPPAPGGGPRDGIRFDDDDDAPRDDPPKKDRSPDDDDDDDLATADPSVWIPRAIGAGYRSSVADATDARIDDDEEEDDDDDDDDAPPHCVAATSGPTPPVGTPSFCWRTTTG